MGAVVLGFMVTGVGCLGVVCFVVLAGLVSTSLLVGLLATWGLEVVSWGVGFLLVHVVILGCGLWVVTWVLTWVVTGGSVVNWLVHVAVLGCGLWVVTWVVTSGGFVVNSKFSCPVRFSWVFILVLALASSLSFPLNISWINNCTLLFSGLAGCWLLVLVGVGWLVGFGLGGLGRGVGSGTDGSETAAVVPTLGGLGWGLSWRPIFVIVSIPIFRRVASPPPS